MKRYLFKSLFCIFALILIFSLCGCGEDIGTIKETGDISEIKEWIHENVGTMITEDVTLPTTHPTLGGTITWTSTEPEILSDTGEIVERSTKAQEVEVAYIISYNDQLDSEYLTFRISPITLEEAATKFEKMIPSKMSGEEKLYIVTRDVSFVDNYYGVIQVTIDSSNKDVFTNEGKYIKPVSDTNIKLSVQFSDSYRTINKEYDMTVYGKTALDIINEGAEWLDNNFVDMLLTAETGLPTKTDNGCVITWTSSDKTIVSEDGKVTEYPYERYVSLKAKLMYGDGVVNKDYYCKVKAYDTSKMSTEEKLEAYLNILGVKELPKVSFEGGYGTNITQSYGFINLFDGNGPEIIRAIISTDLGNKPNEVRSMTAFVTIHDTGNSNSSADAEMHSRYINNGSGGAQTSWHFSVGDDAIYQQVEDNEIAWHAGDGSRTFELIDTGVKATMGMPLLTFSDDNYFVLGGVKTKIKLPSDTEKKRTGPYGIYTVVGENGNYWMNSTYYNSTYGYICNKGGNRNSVCMETCINTESDYVKTFVNGAKVATMLLRKYNLTCDQILQHNNFSGKDCPTVIRATGYWANFRDLCATYKYGLDNFGDYKFEWTVNGNLSSTGFVSSSASVGDTLTYSVKVTKNDLVVMNKQFTTVLIGK